MIFSMADISQDREKYNKLSELMKFQIIYLSTERPSYIAKETKYKSFESDR